MSRTDDDAYVFCGDQRERLQAAEDFLDAGTRRVVRQLGVGAGARCLEVGAGGGSIAQWLSELVGPAGCVVATDTDTRYLDALPRRANLEVRCHDVLSDPLEEGYYDFAHSRLVFEHLSDPDAGIDKLRRALRPGGLMLIEDGDHVSVVPVSEHGSSEFARMHSVRISEFERAGLMPMFARTLPARFRALGLVEVGNEGRVCVMEGGSPGARWGKLSVAHLRPRLVGPGKLSDAELTRMLELFDDPRWEGLSLIMLAVWGRRPP